VGIATEIAVTLFNEQSVGPDQTTSVSIGRMPSPCVPATLKHWQFGTVSLAASSKCISLDFHALRRNWFFELRFHFLSMTYTYNRPNATSQLFADP